MGCWLLTISTHDVRHTTHDARFVSYVHLPKARSPASWDQFSCSFTVIVHLPSANSQKIICPIINAFILLGSFVRPKEPSREKLVLWMSYFCEFAEGKWTKEKGAGNEKFCPTVRPLHRPYWRYRLAKISRHFRFPPAPKIILLYVSNQDSIID